MGATVSKPNQNSGFTELIIATGVPAFLLGRQLFKRLYLLQFFGDQFAASITFYA